MLPALAALGLALASADLPPAPEEDAFTASLAVGAGWDTNLTRQPGTGPATAAGSIAWRTAAGWIFAPGEVDALLVEATYGGEQYPDGLAPTEHRPGGSIAWVRPLGERLRLRLGGFGEWLGSEDPLRRGVGAGASLTVALQVAAPLVLRAGVTGLRIEAADPAFSTHRTRLRAGATLTAWRGATLALGYAWQTGTDTAWLAQAATTATVVPSGYGFGGGAGSGSGLGGSAGWATSSLLPVAAPASAHVLTVDAEQELGGGVFVSAGWSLTAATSSAAGAWTSQAVQLELGWRR